MLIILEGHDCAGKSTLATQITETLKHAFPNDRIDLYHRGVPRQHPLDEYVGALLDYRPETGRHVVCDRWHVGETVYPRVLNRPTQQTAAVRAYVELFLRSRGAFLVYCQALPDHLRACAEARDDDPDVASRIPRITEEFNRAVATSLLPHMVVNVSDPTSDAAALAVEHAISLANDEAWYAACLNRFITYVGSTRPTLLLFGDRRGPDDTDLADYGLLPAFVPHQSTSGQYLLDVLTRIDLSVPRHRLTLAQVGVANACDVDDPRALWETLGRPETVALGANAHRALRAARVDYRRAPHPQWARRFRYHDWDLYLGNVLNAEVSA